MVYKQRFVGVKICRFECFSAILEDWKCYLILILNIPILRSGAMQVVFINECKSHEIGNQMLFNVMVSFSKAKRWTGYDINIAK